MKTKIYQLLVAALLANSGYALAQTETPQKDISEKDLLEMSLEELMNVQVVSASKKSEKLFEAPLSASVLTREEIKKAGATSIMEALRLMPGLIVREETNGNYDIHIRGLDNVPPNSYPVYAANTTTLVMIDNRPVYNYLQGGTFWESLPIDLNDIDKIEIIRGPSSTLYGPNAVSGVIHIITRKLDKNGWNVVGNAQYGSLNTVVANTSVGYKFNPKLSAIISGNYQGRGRETSYYKVANDRFYNTPDSLYSASEMYRSTQSFPHPNRSMDKYGINAFVHFDPSDKVKLSLATGVQNSEVQSAYGALVVSSLTTSTSNTQYVDVKSTVYGLTGQFSYLKGKQDPGLGFTGSTFDFNTVDASLEYEMKVKNFSLKPGLNYRKAIYDDTQYWDASKKQGLLSGKTQLDTYAGSLRAEYTAFAEKLRLVGGARIDKFTHPDKGFLSYQMAASFKPAADHLVRAVFSRAYRSAFMYDTYLNGLNKIPLAAPGLPPGSYIQVNLMGNTNLEILHSDMIELGYRGKLAENISLDVEVYSITTKNYTDVIVGKSNTQFGNPVVVHTDVKIENIPLAVQQLGTTLSVNYVLKRLQVKPFLTFQKTTLQDYSKYSNTAEASPIASNGGNPAKNNLNSGIGQEENHKFTPSVYGGAFINYQITSKVNFNLNPYYFSSQSYLHRDNPTYNDGIRGVETIQAKLLLNAKVAYAPSQAVSIFLSAKNLLNNTAREYYRTDQMGSMFLVGVNMQY
ncbi:MAG: TonB-dependent receptor plug domain-containing protein [Bacteroidota bacterium]